MPRTTALVTGCIALIVVALLGGCVSNAQPNAFLEAAGSVKEGVLGWKVQHDQFVDLATRGEVDVDVDIFGGEITIVTDIDAKTSTVTLERAGTFGWGRSDAAEALARRHQLHGVA
jgi:hypothetical protein